MTAPDPSPTILVVDDDADVRAALSELLADHGYQAVQSADGREAEAYLRHNPPPDCILLDLLMPRLDGWAVAALMRQGRLPQIPTIVITGAGDRWGYPATPERLLRKPINPESLLSMIGAIVRPLTFSSQYRQSE
jgi:CheY-like chemotaxis protein